MSNKWFSQKGKGIIAVRGSNISGTFFSLSLPLSLSLLSFPHCPPINCLAFNAKLVNAFFWLLSRLDTLECVECLANGKCLPEPIQQ